MKYEDELKYLLSLDFDEVPLVQSNEARESTWKELCKYIDREDHKTKRKARFFYSSIAVVTAVVCGCFAVSHFLKTPDDQNDILWLSESTQFGEKRKVVLEDGSEIWLRNGSKIIYPSDFGKDKRQVYVEGEVFASIAKNPDCPFVMSTDKASVIVRGTKFNLRENSRTDDLEITLVEGSVDLLLGNENEINRVSVESGTILKANREDLSITTRRFDTKSYISWVEKDVLYFNDETFESIIEDLEKRYGIQVVVHRKSLLKIRFFASFVNDESPMQILQTLGADNNMKVVKQSNSIHIY